jgi:hypothetical protein
VLVRALADGAALGRRISARNAKAKAKPRQRKEWNMGIDLKKYVKGRFYSLDEVFDNPAREQIAVVKDGQYDKPVFESGRQVGLNQKSLGILIREWGDDPDAWIGRWVVLSKGEGKDRNGNTIDILMVQPDEPTPFPELEAAQGTPSPKATTSSKSARDRDDEIPF